MSGCFFDTFISFCVMCKQNLSFYISNDNNKKTYTLIVTREASDNNYLSRLSISEGVLSPTFNKDKTDYTSVIPNEYDHVTIDYETMDKEATVQIIGNENLIQYLIKKQIHIM